MKDNNTSKKSFVLYTDQGATVDKLTDAQAGRLFKACYAFHRGEKPKLDALLDIVFTSFQQTFSRDIKKWQNVVQRNIENGKKGGRPRLNKNPKKPSGYFGNPKNLDSDSDSDRHAMPSVIEKEKYWDTHISTFTGFSQEVTKAARTAYISSGKYLTQSAMTGYLKNVSTRDLPRKEFSYADGIKRDN